MSLILVATLGSLCPAAAASQPAELSVTLDRTSVMVGGCVAVILNRPAQDLPKELILDIEGREPVSLVQSAPRIGGKDKSLCLIWVDLEHPVRLGGAPPRLRLQPVFRNSGTLKLRLRSERKILGSWEMRVVAPSEEAKAAMRVLFPDFTPQAPDNSRLACWALALAEEWERPCALVSNVNRLVETLPTVVGHPDWSEIAPALVRHRIMQSELVRVLRRQGLESPGADVVHAGEVLDRVAAEIEKTPAKAPFARAITDQGGLLLEKARRGDLGVKVRFSSGVRTSSTTSATSEGSAKQ